MNITTTTGSGTFSSWAITINKPVLGIPDFARGPDSAHVIKVPNDTGHGIPITLYNAAGVADVTFTLSYNPMLLTVTGGLSGSNSDASYSASSFALVGSPTIIDSMHATANFHFSDSTARSGTVVLGDIVAVVPDSAGSNYRAKELLQLGSIVINAPTNPITGAVSANGVHVNVYFGDVSGDTRISALDVITANRVAQGTDTGFGVYPLVDPVVVGDVALDYSVDAGDVSDIAAYIQHLLGTQVIPTPPIAVFIIISSWF